MKLRDNQWKSEYMEDGKYVNILTAKPDMAEMPVET
jgi:hypothetical protein